MFDWLFEPARMQFCEAAVSGPIKHPADTWSNIGPLIAGVAILLSARRTLTRVLGGAGIWTAIASAYFHATDTILGEVLDLSGMFAFVFTVAALQHERSARTFLREHAEGGHLPRVQSLTLAALVVVATLIASAASAYSTAFASPAFAVVVLVIVIREVRHGDVNRWGWAAMGTLLVAWGFWWLDYLAILCNPDNHLLTGHGLWHLLNGLVFWFTYKYFADR